MVLGHWLVLVGFVWMGSDGLPFLVVGVVSLVWRAVLHSFAPGLQPEVKVVRLWNLLSDPRSFSK